VSPVKYLRIILKSIKQNVTTMCFMVPGPVSTHCSLMIEFFSHLASSDHNVHENREGRVVTLDTSVRCSLFMALTGIKKQNKGNLI
jgi:hypothetical protein